MFSESYIWLDHSKTTFFENVNDSFGESIVKSVYDPCLENVKKLNLVWADAELQKNEVNMLIAELRMII